MIHLVWLVVLCAAVVSIFMAAEIMVRTTWHYCPRCKRWHNEEGTLCAGQTPHPSTVALVGKPKRCDSCEFWDL